MNWNGLSPNRNPFPVHFDGYPKVACGVDACRASIVTTRLPKVTRPECLRALYAEARAA